MKTVVTLCLWLMCGNMSSAAEDKEATAPDVADRLKLLKPVMTLAEVNKIWQGLPVHGQACGTVVDKDGKERGAYWNVYLFKLPGAAEMQSMKFGHIEGADGYLFGFSGPGFRYVLKDDRYVVAEATKEAGRADDPPSKAVEIVAKLQKVTFSPTRARYRIALFKVVQGKADDFSITSRAGKMTEKYKALWKAINAASIELEKMPKDFYIRVQLDAKGRPDIETWRLESPPKKEAK